MKKFLFIFCTLMALFLLGNCNHTGTNESTTDFTSDSSVSTDIYGLVNVPSIIGYPMGLNEMYTDEYPVHTVALSEFYIGKYEVTYALWSEVKTWAESNGYVFTHEGRQGGSTSDPFPYDNTDQHPVTHISWRDCIAWCNAYSEKEGLNSVYYTNPEKTDYYKNSYIDGEISNDYVDWNANGFRLPTEAEWEYAARRIGVLDVSPGDQHSGYNLETDIELCAWCADNFTGSTHPVGQLLGNSLELYDMSGNVWEWCWDEFDSYPDGYAKNPHGPTTILDKDYYYRVHRGGCWHLKVDSHRTAYRGFSGRGTTSVEIYTGFRVVRIEPGL